MNRIMYIIILGVLIGLTIFTYNDHLFMSGKESKTILVKNGEGPGQDAIIPAHPQRVVFLNSSSLDLWVGAGGKDMVVAYLQLQTAPEGIYDKLNKESINLGTNNNVSTELIMQQNPDLIVGSGVGGNMQSHLKTILKQAGIPLLTIANQSVADTYYEMRLYGQMTGHPELAEREINRLESNIARIANTYQGKVKPKVALIWGTTSSFALLVPNCRQGEFLALAGGQNIVKESNSSSRSVPISLEYIAQEDPDYIFFINMGDRKKIQAALDSTFNAASSWHILRAVKEGNVHVLPPELFTAHYGLSIDKAIEYMNEILYPKT